MQHIRNLMLPIAVVLGLFFHDFFAQLAFIVPYLIFCTLFLTYCNLKINELKFSKFHLTLLLFQIITGIVLYFIFVQCSGIVAQGVMISALAPTATAAVVVANMLGASIATMTTYTMLCNLTMAIVCPIFFTIIGSHSELGLLPAMGIVFVKVFPLLVLPLIIGVLFQKFLPKLTKQILKHKYTSFYLWSISLTIAIGSAINYIILQQESQHKVIIQMSIAALLLCVWQFGVGRLIGKKYGDIVSGGQSVGQKNTILAIWMAQTFLNPLASIVPAMYIIWQNLFNSYQLWQKSRKELQK